MTPSCPLAPRTESYDTSARNSDQLHLDRPSDQLSPRTPPAIVYPDVRTNGSLQPSSNSPRHPCVCSAVVSPFV
jgi:hypothetical protein